MKRRTSRTGSMLPPPDSMAGRGELIAPRGQFRVVGVDTMVGPFEDFLVGDFTNLDAAKREAAARAKKWRGKFYAYNDRGKLMFSA